MKNVQVYDKMPEVWSEKNVYGALVNLSVVVKFDEEVTEIICFNCFGS